jgi:hypothetical protein
MRHMARILDDCDHDRWAAASGKYVPPLRSLRFTTRFHQMDFDGTMSRTQYTWLDTDQAGERCRIADRSDALRSVSRIAPKIFTALEGRRQGRCFGAGEPGSRD